jgi:hypothetical protein
VHCAQHSAAVSRPLDAVYELFGTGVGQRPVVGAVHWRGAALSEPAAAAAAAASSGSTAGAIHIGLLRETRLRLLHRGALRGFWPLASGPSSRRNVSCDTVCFFFFFFFFSFLVNGGDSAPNSAPIGLFPLPMNQSRSELGPPMGGGQQ